MAPLMPVMGIGRGLVLHALPSAAAAGSGGYAAHRLTSVVADARPEQLEPRPVHVDTIVDLVAPLPALGLGAAAIGASARQAYVTRRVVEVVEDADTGAEVRIARQVRPGWSTGSRMLRAGGFGALAGTAVAVGLAVPIALAGAKLVGAGSEAAVRAALPDWAEGPVGAANRLQRDAIGVVVDAGRRVVAGPEPEVHRFRSEFDVPPGTFDPVRSLGLDGEPLTATVEDREQVEALVMEELLDRIEVATGVRPEPVPAR